MISRSDQMSQLNKHRGVGMVEVLVTLFILSIGILGVASLQLISSFSNAEALNRSQSVMVAQQLSERLRANAKMSLVGDGLVVNSRYFNQDIYNFDNLDCANDGTDFNCFCLSRPAGIPNCSGEQCSAAEIAVYDGYEASCSAVSSNPNIVLNVNCDDNNVLDIEDCSAGSRINIILAWPVDNWQNIDRQLNAQCNVNQSQPHDCVRLDVVL